MSDDPGSGDNPFSGLPFFGAFPGGLGGAGSDPWSTARQLAASIAQGGESEPNVEPATRIAFEQLSRVAELQVQQATGLRVSDGSPPPIRPATRHEWALEAIDAYRPLLERLGTALSTGVTTDLDTDDLDLSELDDMPGLGGMGGLGGDFMRQIMGMLGPMMLSMTAGSTVGSLARSNLGSYDLPLPRSGSDELLVISANIEAFTEEWSVPSDDVRLWVCLHEYLHHAVLRLPHVHERLTDLTGRYVDAFEAAGAAFTDRFGDIDMSDPTSMESLEGLMSDPESLMGVVQSDRQRAMLPEISAVLAAIVGWVDHHMDSIGASLIASYGMLSEALRRRRVTAAPSDRFLERMLGLELDQACYEQGRSFIDGVLERGGTEALTRLWESAAMLPTPNEIVAPGLWLARISLEIDEPAGNDEEE